MKKKKKIDISTYKPIIINIVILLLVILVTFLIVTNFKLTKYEKININKFSKERSNYLDSYYSKDNGNYVLYSIEYLYNTKHRNNFKTKEIVNEINNTFDVKYTSNMVRKIGISEEMVDKGISYDSSKDEYIYNSLLTRSDIANYKIVKYDIKSIKKINRNKYKIVYNKLEVDNPYEVYNYFNSEKKDSKKASIALSYLKGESKIGTIKNLINSDNISHFGKISGTTNVILIVKGNKLLIK